MKKSVFLLLLATVACLTPPGPTPVPSPTPIPPVGVVDAGMLLHANGTVLTQADGNAFDFRGAVACCFTEAGEPDPVWPLGSVPWFDYLKEHGNINFVHMRLGPWRAGPGAEDAQQDAPYAEVNGKANLDVWNNAFWTRVDLLLSEAAKRGIWVEIDLIDGWGIKHCGWGDIPAYHPWAPTNNTQGVNECLPAFSGNQDVWVRKAVEVTGRHGNVTYETSNEGGLVQGWTGAWETDIINAVRDEETKRGYPRHLIATNAERDVPAADWNEFHTNGQPAPPTGKITGTNEYNPEPSLSGTVVSANYCVARTQGSYYWLWRHGMSRVEWEKALGNVKAGCGGAIANCHHPDFDSGGWKTICPAGQAEGGKNCDITATLSPAHLNELGAAIGRVKARNPALWNDRCLVGGGTPPGDDPAHAAERWALFESIDGQIAEELRAGGVCAWLTSRVEIMSLRNDGLWGQSHPLAMNTGCLAGNPYIGTWKEP
jgi:hypothetical protein